MYLDGQLPYGPDTSNVGAPPVPTFDDPGIPTTYTTPEGGSTVVHSSVADMNGIVPTPEDPAKAPRQGVSTNSARYDQCGDYAADGSLSTIRSRRPNDPQCGVASSPTSPSVGMGLFLAAMAGLILLTPKGGR